MSKPGSNSWSAYQEYNKVLRAWFVAFGFGVPATFLLNNDLVKYISLPNGEPHIFVVFLIGAGTQVFMALLNKSINWCMYYKKRKFPKGKPKNIWEGLANGFSKASNWYLIDVVADVVTFACFAYAIVRLFVLVTCLTL